MNTSWSDQIEQRFHLSLPRDLADWLDGGIWQQSVGAEFREPQSPEQILNPEDGVIWAGFMLPDTLPLIGNDYGDWLCLRVAEDGTIGEVICWCHGGGDWIPYGSSLAEALIYDAAFTMLYPPRPEMDPPGSQEEVNRALQWARGWIEHGDRLGEFWNTPDGSPPLDPLDELSRASICQIPAQRDRILRSLESPLKSQSDPKVADAIGASWEPDFVSWIFDTALIPELRKDHLRRHFQSSVTELTQQDWDSAEQEALKVTAIRSDLGWAFDIAGWAAERKGHIDRAIELYQRGVRASAFADDSIRFRTHWFTEGYGKFAAARLYEWRDRLPTEVQQDPYLQLFWENDPESLRARLRDYWVTLAEQAEQTKQHLTAYRYFYNAGWDCGCHYVKSYEAILAGMSRNALAAGFKALAEVSDLHRRCL